MVSTLKGKKMRDYQEALDFIERGSLDQLMEGIIQTVGFTLEKDYFFSLKIEQRGDNNYYPVFEIEKVNGLVLVSVPLDKPIPSGNGYSPIIPSTQTICLYTFMADGMPYVYRTIACIFMARADYLIVSIFYDKKGTPHLGVKFIFSQGLVFEGSVPYEQVKNCITIQE
jgi:hypothetical protein